MIKKYKHEGAEDYGRVRYASHLLHIVINAVLFIV